MKKPSLDLPCTKVFDAETLAYLGELGLNCPGLAVPRAEPVPAPAGPPLPRSTRPVPAGPSRWRFPSGFWRNPVRIGLRTLANLIRNLSLAFGAHPALRVLRIMTTAVAWILGLAILGAVAVGLAWIALALLWAILVCVVWPLVKVGLVLLILVVIIGCLL